jgi:hypothetical protein
MTESPPFADLLADLGGVVYCSAASLSASPSWLSSHLARVLGRTGLALPPVAVESYITAALLMSSAPDATARAADAANLHAEKLFGVGLGTELLRRVLEADIRGGSGYDARTREACLRMLIAMRLPPRVLYDVEVALRDGCSDELARARGGAGGTGGGAVDVAEDESMVRHSRGRWLKIGGATVLSGVALGLSGGMLAPAILPALSSIGLTAAGGAGASAALAAAFGTAGAGLGGSAMRNRVGELEEFSFERCVCVDGPAAGGAQGGGAVTPRGPVLEVSVAAAEAEVEEGAVSTVAPSLSSGGSLLVYVFETWPSVPAVVPAGVRFGVQRTVGGAVCEWVVPEQALDAGGRAKRQRHTGAVTVLERPRGDVRYVMRWTLVPGSLATNVSYRAAWVPCGHELPAWIMGKEESGDGVRGLHRAPSSSRGGSLSCSLFVPGLLPAGAEHVDPGMISDQFCAPGGVVSVLKEVEVESFALVWETKLLAELSSALQGVARRVAVSVAAQHTAAALVPAVMGAVALPITIVGGVRAVIDNVWAKAMSRAQSAGIMLAAELAARGFGRRPVTLSGYSLGALIVFVACEELARRELQGLVHDVHLVGAPVPAADTKRWEAVRGVVSGRLVNVFNPGDWYLDVLSKGAGSSFGRLAGRAPVLLADAGIENVSVDDLGIAVQSHGDLAARVSEILVRIGVGSGERRRTWPWSWAPSAAEDARSGVEEFTAGDHRLKPSASFEPPPSPPVVVFSNRRHRGKRSSQSQPPPSRLAPQDL